MSSDKINNREILISLSAEIQTLTDEMKIIKEDISYIRHQIEDNLPIVLDCDGDESDEPVKSWFWSS